VSSTTHQSKKSLGFDKLFDAAKSARERSYSPYSGHKVGAAIRLKNGQIFSGCNVENSSYGATVCAERTAVQKAVSELGTIEIEEVLVVTDANPPWPPCGLCRQVLAEFAPRDGQKNIELHACNLSGVVESTSFNEIFPQAFTPSHLKK
jgi:cytidine deaminase